MIVSFDGEAMRSISLEQTVAGRILGEAVAVRFHALLAEMEAAETAGDLLSLYGAAASAHENDSLLVSFGPESSARFRIVSERGAFDAEGRPVWSEVRRLKLTGVEVDGHAI